jgi:MFS family permease
MEYCAPHFTKDLKSQYRHLRVYSFFWWACYSLLLIFQPLYLVRIGFPLWAIFANGAFDAIVSILFQSSWSNYADRHGTIRQFMFLGNIFTAGACFLIMRVSDIWTLFLLTFIFRVGPSSDAFAVSLVYKFADYCIPEAQTSSSSDKKAFAINFFSQYRKFGSIGWAIFAPVGGILINNFNFGMNFYLGGIGFILITIYGILTIKTDDLFKIGKKQSNNQNSGQSSHNQIDFEKNQKADEKSVQRSKNNSVLVTSIKDLLQNKVYRTFLLAGVFYTVSINMTYQTQGIFYGLFAPNDYFAIAMTYAVAAFVEWPVMGRISKSVKKLGWEYIIVLSYVGTAIRFFFSPFLILWGGNIWWAYFFQIFTGIIFGMRWPATTLGIHSVLRDDQKTLGQSFYGSTALFASLLGNIIGASIALVIKKNLENSFIVLYWVAAVLATISAVWFYKKIKQT